MKLAVLFGGASNEHEVSVVSASSVIKHLDHEKYDVMPIYLDRENRFFLWKEDVRQIQVLPIGTLPMNLEEIQEPFSFLKTFDCVFLMVHGKYGEDGILSSILEFLNIPYVGNQPAASMITMDKIYTKEILELNHVATAPFVSFMKYLDFYLMDGKALSFEEVCKQILSKLSFPMFVKPANSGSSIGITKVNSSEELKEAIRKAQFIDERVLVEKMIVGREVECAILEVKGEIKASCVGEVLADDAFYSFDAKYKNPKSRTVIPASLSFEDANQIQQQAILAFQLLNLHGYSRVDFFLTEDHRVILNEINTIPGFTEISMYPKLWEASGISYSELLDFLITEKAKK